MSVSTNDIKKKISATENMSKITRAMQMVSAAKLTKIEAHVQQFYNYHAEIKRIVSTLQTSEYVSEHPFITGWDNKKGESRKIGCVVITSNRGLVGGYNNKLFQMLKDGGGGYNNELFKIVGEKVASDDDFKFYVTGQKGTLFARSELPETCTQTYLFPDEIQYTDIIGLATQLISDYINGEIGEVVVVYQDFISKLAQEATRKVLLPLEFDVAAETMPNYEIKPTQKKVCDNLLIQYVMTSLYEIFLTANRAEHAARMNSMSNATDNAEEIIKESKLLYNRARQAAITQELNEIVAGANAVNN